MPHDDDLLRTSGACKPPGGGFVAVQAVPPGELDRGRGGEGVQSRSAPQPDIEHVRLKFGGRLKVCGNKALAGGGEARQKKTCLGRLARFLVQFNSSSNVETDDAAGFVF